MARNGITVTGADRLVDALDGLADDLVDWSTVNAAAAQQLASATRRNAPVRTGALRSSVTVDSDALSADVRVTVRYARPVEALRHYMSRARRDTQAARDAAYADKVADDVGRANR